MPLPCAGEMIEVYVPEKGTHGLVLYTVFCTSGAGAKMRNGKRFFKGMHHPQDFLCNFSCGDINRILSGQEAREAYEKYKRKTKKEANYEH